MTDPDTTPSGPDHSGPDGASVSEGLPADSGPVGDDADAVADGEEEALPVSFVRRHLPWLVGAGTALAVVLVALIVSLLTGGEDAPAPASPESSTVASSEQPRSLAVPSIGLKAAVVPIAIDPAGVLTPPASPLVGWWMRSAVPGQATGQMLITGHTIHDGYGIMNRLGDVKPGDLVSVTNDEGTTRYETDKVEVLSKQELADNAQELFGQDHGDGRLVLVTCDDFVDGEYLSNIVLFAHPVDDGEDSPSDATAAGAR